MTKTAARPLPPIFAMASNNWDGPWMNRQQLLSRLGARGWPIIYSCGPLWGWERGTQVWREAHWRWRAQQRDNVTVALTSKFIPRWARLPAWDRAALRLHATRMRRLAGNADVRAAIMFLFEPSYFPYIEAFQARHVAFHVRDVYDHMPQWRESMRADFDALQRRADLLTVAAAPFVSTLLPEVQSRARLLTNAADVATYGASLAAPCPSDLAAIPRPRIGYTGVISLKVDLPLISALAQRHPEAHWVFIGPVTGHGTTTSAAADWERLLAQPNIHWLGSRQYDKVPAYVGHMDVNIMPYVTDQRAGGWARFAYPLKLHEYLATGKPVISADLPELYVHRDVLEVVDGLEAWDAALRRALSGHAPGSAAQRQAVASKHSWDRRVDQLDAWLRELIAWD